MRVWAVPKKYIHPIPPSRWTLSLGQLRVSPCSCNSHPFFLIILLYSTVRWLALGTVCCRRYAVSAKKRTADFRDRRRHHGVYVLRGRADGCIESCWLCMRFLFCLATPQRRPCFYSVKRMWVPWRAKGKCTQMCRQPFFPPLLLLFVFLHLFCLADKKIQMRQ